MYNFAFILSFKFAHLSGEWCSQNSIATFIIWKHEYKKDGHVIHTSSITFDSIQSINYAITYINTIYTPYKRGWHSHILLLLLHPFKLINTNNSNFYSKYSTTDSDVMMVFRFVHINLYRTVSFHLRIRWKYDLLCMSATDFV